MVMTYNGHDEAQRENQLYRPARVDMPLQISVATEFPNVF